MNRLVLSILLGILLSVGANSLLAQETDETETPAKVVLTEYSDFQCPSCQYFYPIVKRLKKEYGDLLKVKYKHFPLNSHQYAALAARAAEAADEQGKFKEMHDLLFENQTRWASSVNPQAIFVGYAKELELDVEKFKEDLNSAEMQKIVMEEKRKGQERGVNATPTFFINGQKIEQAPPTFRDFKALLDSFIQETN